MKKSVNTLFEAHGAAWVDIIGSQYATNGISDKLACVQGRFFAVEVKAGTNMPTALQIKYLRQVHAAGGVALVISETNLDHLQFCLRYPHRAESNFEAFTTDAVRAALDGGTETDPPTLKRKARE